MAKAIKVPITAPVNTSLEGEKLIWTIYFLRFELWQAIAPVHLICLLPISVHPIINTCYMHVSLGHWVQEKKKTCKTEEVIGLAIVSHKQRKIGGWCTWYGGSSLLCAWERCRSPTGGFRIGSRDGWFADFWRHLKNVQSYINTSSFLDSLGVFAKKPSFF